MPFMVTILFIFLGEGNLKATCENVGAVHSTKIGKMIRFIFKLIRRWWRMKRYNRPVKILFGQKP